jgi:hypothetical protein
MDNMDSLLEHFLDPISGSPANHKEVLGLVVLHVDDLFLAGSHEFERQVVNRIKKDYKIGSEDVDDITFTGQRVRWNDNCITVD